MTAPKFYTFEEWLDANPELKKIRIIDCDNCCGEGKHECECGDIHDCDCCHGDGKIENSALRKRYEETKQYDQERWNELAGVKNNESNNNNTQHP